MGGNKEVCNRALLQTSLVGIRGNQKNWGGKCKSLTYMDPKNSKAIS